MPAVSLPRRDRTARRCIRFAALIGAAVIAAGTSAHAQSRPIRGTVTDQQGRPIAGAAVRVTSVSESVVGFVMRDRQDVVGRTWQTTSGETGGYLVSVPASGVYVVSASKEGFGQDETQIVVELSGVSNVNLRLRAPARARETPPECGADIRRATSDPQMGAPETSHPSLARLFLWLRAVQSHTPGCADSSVLEVSKWSPSDFAALLGDIANLSAFLQWARGRPGEKSADARTNIEPLDGKARQSSQARFLRDANRAAIILYNRRYDIDSIETHFHGNDTLKRGSVLHADIATFVPGTFTQYTGVGDGHVLGGRRGTVHWQIGRQLLDTLTTAPGSDMEALLWYRAVSAHLFREGRLAEVARHLDRARQIFPGHSLILLDSAYLHLELASPAIQAAIREVRAEGADVAVDSRRHELERAERFLRGALTLAPDDAEARYRLGHTLGELGRHQEAAAELRRAIDANPNATQLYLAELVLGRQEHTLGRKAEAVRHYENAAALFPNAQSPRLALSQLARQSGDPNAARYVVEILAAPQAESDRDDPWLSYYLPHREDAARLMREMRERVGGRK